MTKICILMLCALYINVLIVVVETRSPRQQTKSHTVRIMSTQVIEVQVSEVA